MNNSTNNINNNPTKVRLARLFVYLQLFRWKNVLLLIGSQIIFKYLVFPSFAIPSNLNDFQFCLLTLTTALIAMGGYIINDVFDIKCDHINKPQKAYIPDSISKKGALQLYYACTALGLALGIYLSFDVNHLYYSFLFLSISASLYLYSSTLKKSALLGNILISTLVALNILILLPFELDTFSTSNGIIFIIKFSGFSFFINLLREIVKDIEDIKGDYNAKMKTLPIILGVERTKKLIQLIGLFPLYFLIRFLVDDLKNRLGIQIYFTFTIILPLLYFLIKLKNCKTPQQFHNMSSLLKWILIFGLLLILLITCFIN